MSVYLIHFSEPYKHARHYIGYTPRSVAARFADHVAGRAARLTQVVVQAGITLELVRKWPGETRVFERQLKRRGGAARICPKCKGDTQ